MCCSPKVWVLVAACIGCENRRTCKAKDVIILKILGNLLMHLAKLTAMAFVKDKHDMLTVNRVSGIFRDKGIQLLNGGNKDFVLVEVPVSIFVFKLTL